MLTIVSHDAGGAEIVSSYARQQGTDFIGVLLGPAQAIFERKLGSVETLPLDEAIHRSTSVLCGTSWQSDLEFNAIKMARQMGKRSVAFLDHWVHYRERFTRESEFCPPDEIWVGDSYAYDIAVKDFQGTTVRLVDNPYFLEMKQEIVGQVRALKKPRLAPGLSILYVCEPIADHGLLRYGNARHWGYTEQDALRYFLSNLEALNEPVSRIILRPHPAEPSAKYDWARLEYGEKITVGGPSSLLEDIVASDLVVGCNSTAMVVGILAGKRVFSSIPPKGHRCLLPHPEIEHLRQILTPSG